MPVKRRYPVGENKLYDHSFDKSYRESRILNPKARETDISAAFMDLKSKSSLENLLGIANEQKAELQNSLNADTANARDYGAAPSNKEKFDQYEINQVNAGKCLPGKCQEPTSLKEERLSLEGVLDITLKEIDYLQNLLETIDFSKQTKEDKNILKRGCHGSSRLHNGILCEIDGMPTCKAKDGILIVDCLESPFHLISVFDYYQLIEKYFKSRNKLQHLQDKLKEKWRQKGFNENEIQVGCSELVKKTLHDNPEMKIQMIQFRGKSIPDPQGIERHEKADGMVRTKTEKIRTTVPIVSQKGGN